MGPITSQIRYGLLFTIVCAPLTVAVAATLNVPGDFPTIQQAIDAAADAKRPLLKSAVNWGEVDYLGWRARGEKAANAKLKEIAQPPIQVVDADMESTRLAASLKAAPTGRDLRRKTCPTPLASPPPRPVA